ncbi:hypothetical protein B0T17DRAFT_538064 [Bombardia bombarda]|uniref:NAD(P)-binding protein n=1 Tax=Bombardia bombarda TaxID=252184 RepID=A0AA40BYM3_9PEZI|nr:hypothetical protein B0T17DRAFT_538064 [Bombardia bombarda]
MSHFDQWTLGVDVVRKLREHIDGKNIVITGATLGSIGGAVFLALAEAHPAQLFLLGRSDAKTSAAIAAFQRIQQQRTSTSFSSPSGNIDATTAEVAAAASSTNTSTTALHAIPCDLSDLSSVRLAAAAIRAQALGGKIHVLFNNAGVHLVYPYRTTAQGFECHFGLNHYAHFLLTAELWPLLCAATTADNDAVIVTTSSSGCQMSPMLWDEIERLPQWGGGESYQPWLGYALSKLANALFTVGLARRIATAAEGSDRLASVRAFAVQPGQPKTHLWDSVTEEGPTSVMEAFRLGKDGPLAGYDSMSLFSFI